MSNNINLPKGVLEDIYRFFKYLFDRGYEIDSAANINPGWLAWNVILKKQNFYVKLEAEKGGLDLLFGSPTKGFMAIRPLIYFLSEGKNYIKAGFFDYSMKKEADLLEKHIDDIEERFEGEFPATEEEVKIAEAKYFNRKSIWQRILLN